MGKGTTVPTYPGRRMPALLPALLPILVMVLLGMGAAAGVEAQEGAEPVAAGTPAAAEPAAAAPGDPTPGDPTLGDGTPGDVPAQGLRVLCAYRAGSVDVDGAAAGSAQGSAPGSTGGSARGRGPGSVPGSPGAAEAPVVCPGEAAASLGTRVYVRVSDLRGLLDSTPTGEADCRGLVLFLAGAPLEGITPTSCDLGSNEVAFDLRRVEEDDEDWHALLGRPLQWSRQVRLTVGPNADFPLPTDVRAFELVILTPGETLFFLLFLAASLGVFFRLAATSPMLKDSQAEAAKDKLPYSLSRSQMAWWFFLAAASYLLIWLVIGELDTLPPSILGLIGISSATAVAATAIDGRKKAQEEQAEAVSKAASAAAVAGEEGSLQTPSPDATGLEARVRSLQAAQEAERLKGSVKGETLGSWLLDVLSDGSGISFHRFQVVGWTALLGLIFLWEVYTRLTMPDFSATLLGLMSISSGTYLGLKLPERPGRS